MAPLIYSKLSIKWFITSVRSIFYYMNDVVIKLSLCFLLQFQSCVALQIMAETSESVAKVLVDNNVHAEFFAVLEEYAEDEGMWFALNPCFYVQSKNTLNPKSGVNTPSPPLQSLMLRGCGDHTTPARPHPPLVRPHPPHPFLPLIQFSQTYLS